MLRLLFTRRWLGYLALTVTFAVIASLFGMWQWDRRGQAVAAIEKVNANFDQAPVALSTELSRGSLDSDAREWDRDLFDRGAGAREDETPLRGGGI